jgi:MIP family channel proteins
MNRNLFNKAFAEALGTFAITLFGCGAISVSQRFPGAVSSGTVPIAFGLVVATMIYAVGHISGAHFNPAVTLAFAVARHFPRQQLLIYWVAQFLGALGGIAFLAATLPIGSSLGATVPTVAILAALLWEVVLTFFLMFVIISVATDTRAVGVMAGVAIGGTVALAAIVGGPLTGASMNPARSLAPAIFEGHFSALWLYFIGPAIGSVAAALVYNFIRCETLTSSTSDADLSRKNAKGCC